MITEVLIIFLPVLIIGLITWYILRSRGPRKSKAAKETHSTRQDRAVWAWAKILGTTRGAADLSDWRRVELQLEVHMPGSQPYEARTTWLVDQEGLEYIEVGREISLKVDPQGPQYVYPKGPWAKFVE